MFRSNEKQFLFTRKVPCAKRCSQLQYDPKLELIIKDDESQEEWVDTHHYYSGELSTDVKDLTTEEPVNSKQADPVEEGDEEPIDMDEFMANEEVEDPNCFNFPVQNEEGIEKEDNVLKTRTYNLHITYDKYYQVRIIFVALIRLIRSGSPLLG